MKFYNVIKKEDAIIYYCNNQLHRESGPAIEDFNGNKEWYFNGKRHRTDGPAIELVNGHRKWYLNDKIHREDGPAIEWIDNSIGLGLHSCFATKEWWINGKRHREDGPAVEKANGTKYWYKNGRLSSRF